MGFFSWITSDTGKSIPSCYSNRRPLDVTVLCPNGDKINEKDYDGYGHFGGRDIYALLAQWNEPDGCKDEDGNWLPDDDIRRLGIDIQYGEDKTRLKYPIKIVENGSLNYEDVPPSKDDPDQGYFYEE